MCNVSKDEVASAVSKAIQSTPTAMVRTCAWNDDFTIVIALAPTGRATVESLQLNRDGVVNLRHVLYVIGKNPPTELN